MPSDKAWVWKIENLSFKDSERKGLKVPEELLIKIGKCFARVNIFNQSKLLHSNMIS